MPEEWKVSITVPIYKKGDKTDCCDYRGISLLSTTHKSLCNILLSKLTPHAEEIIGDHQYGFRRNGSTTDLYSAFIKCFRKKMQYNEVVLQLFMDFKKTYDSVSTSS